MKATLVEIHLSVPVRWRVNASDPALFPVTVANLQLLNPALVNGHGQIEPTSFAHVVVPTPNEVIFASRSLLLLDVDRTSSESPVDHRSLAEPVGVLLQWLRVLTWQVQIPNAAAQMIVAISQRETDVDFERLDVPFELVLPGVIGSVRRDVVETAATIQNVQTVAPSVACGARPPVSHQFFGDAAAAHGAADYRACLLAAAISAESLAGEYLERSYEARLHGSSGPDLRPLGPPVYDRVRDPVYEELVRRRSFKSLLHERPLYLENRSLLVDNKPLYNLMLALYSTRNRIAHTGSIDESTNNGIPATKLGGVRALTGLHELHAWFGQPVPALNSIPSMAHGLGEPIMIEAVLAEFGGLGLV